MMDVVVQLESNSQDITAAKEAITKDKLPHESEECFIPEND